MSTERQRFDPGNLPKALVVLGAGANKEIQGDARAIDDIWEPPLANELFGVKLEKIRWRTLFEEYSGAVAIAARLALIARKGTFGLEQALRQLSEHSDPSVRDNFREVPAYLRDLLHTVSTQYTSSPTTFIQLCAVLMSDHPHNIAFVTTNYDTFLEQALNYHDPSIYEFTEMGHYIDPRRQAKVFKIHGSVDWFVPLERDPDGWQHAVRAMDDDLSWLRHQVFVNRAIPVPVSAHFQDAKHWYPVLTAPLAGKDESSLVCPPEHEEALREFVRNCEKILIIGNSGTDDDLMALLTMDLTQPRVVYVVGQSKSDASEIAGNFKRNVESIKRIHGSVFMEPARGARDFISGERLEDFAALTLG